MVCGPQQHKPLWSLQCGACIHSPSGAVPAFQKSPQTAAPEGRRLLGRLCPLRMLTTNEQSLGRASQTQPSCSQSGEATVDSHSLAHLRFMGRGDISMCPSQAQPGRWESGSLLGPDLGHLPRRSVLSRVWMSLTGGPSWSSASSTPVGAISRAARVPRGHKTNLSLVNYLTNLPSVDRTERWEKTVCVK